jgi:hypothetical protein
MKHIFCLKTILMLCMIALTAFVVSCDDEGEGTTGEVTLLSFGPAGVQHGETIKFIGTNLDKVTSIVLPPGIEIAASGFASQSKDQIELVIPDAAEAGKLKLMTPDGEIETKTELSFDVDVEVTSITTEAKPGTNVTITGNHVNWIEEVIFTDGVSVTEFVSKSLNELVVTVPMEAQTGKLGFITGGTDPLSFTSESELIVSLPAVTSMTTSARHTHDITLTGTNLDLVTEVVLGGNKSVTTFKSHSESEIVLTVPVGTLNGKLTLKQLSPVTVTTAGELTIILPKGTSLTPQPAVPGTDNITINGTNLNLVKTLKLAGTTGPIEVAATSFISQSATQIVLALPGNADNGGVSYVTIDGDYSSTLGVNVVLPGAGPAPLSLTMYDEAIHFGGGNWSWGNTTVTLSTEQAYLGTKSWKHTNTGTDGGASAGGMSGVNATGKTHFKFALYGGPGTNNKQVAAILNDNWGNYNSVIIKEGQWTEFSIPVTSYPAVSMSNITRWTFKLEGAAAGQYYYVDRVGFD